MAGLKCDGPGLVMKGSELRGGVGDVDARHVCEPEKSADDGHVRLTELGHFVMLDGAGNGLVGGRELEAFLHRRVEVTRARALKVGPEFGDEISCVEGLQQVEGACSAVAGNRSVEDPLELALVFGREPLRDVGDEASAQVGAAVDDEDVVDVDKCPQ